LEGISIAWKNRVPINWLNLFNFIKEYINRNEFWQDKFKIKDNEFWDANHQWIIGMIGELIQDGTSDEEWTIPDECIPIIKEIILHILDNLTYNPVNEIEDAVTYALNSVHGKIIAALISFLRFTIKIEKRERIISDISLSYDLINIYDNLVKEEIIEAYILFGQYLPLLYSIDSLWVEKTANEFKDIKDILWESFMSGYLFNRIIYYNSYQLMRDHYLKAISHNFKEKYAEEGVVQHIALGFLHDIEDSLEDSLFDQLINTLDFSQIQKLIKFFWMQRDRFTDLANKKFPTIDSIENEKIREKIIDFWRLIYGKYKHEKSDSLNENEKRILSNVALLTIFLQEIDNENVKWLNLSAPYVALDNVYLFFLEYLDDLKMKGNKIKSGKYVGKIFLKMLDGFIPQFKEEYIRSIVEYLYETRQREITMMADEICNIYLSNGYNFLRDIYEKNRIY
jgi:hypothetical protein